MYNANVLYSPPEPLWFLILEKLVKLVVITRRFVLFANTLDIFLHILYVYADFVR